MIMALPALGVLIYSGFFDFAKLEDPELKNSLIYVAILGIVGTGLTIMVFNRLIQISTPVFSTSVTYLTPIVGILWGVLDGEYFGLFHILSAGIILMGVYVVNRSKTRKKKIPRPYPLD